MIRQHPRKKGRFGGALLRLVPYGAIAAGLPAVAQIVILGSTKRYGLLSAVGWGFFFVLGPSLVLGAILGVVGFLAWWLLRRYSRSERSLVRGGVVGVIVGTCGALPLGTLMASTELQIDPAWAVPLAGAYLALAVGCFVLWWERREGLHTFSSPPAEQEARSPAPE